MFGSDTYSDVPPLHQSLRHVVDIHSIKFDSISTRYGIKSENDKNKLTEIMIDFLL